MKLRYNVFKTLLSDYKCGALLTPSPDTLSGCFNPPKFCFYEISLDSETSKRKFELKNDAQTFHDKPRTRSKNNI